MKSCDVVGYVVAGEVICVDCAGPGEDYAPLFAGSEWDSAPVCCTCGEVLDVNVIEAD